MLDALRPQWPDKGVPCIVVDRDDVAAACGHARHLGVKIGMRKSGATVLAPQACLIERAPQAEHAALQRAALALLQYTPEVAFAHTHALLLDVSASLMMFNGPRRLSQLVARTLRRLGLRARVGMAPTAQGAWLLASTRAEQVLNTPAGARSGAARTNQVRPPVRRCVRMASLHRHLNPLAIECLPATAPRRDWLDGVGCHTLGALRALPRAPLQRRIGTEVLRALDTAYGDRPDIHVWFTPAEHFDQRIELIERIEHTTAVTAVLHELINQMGGWLNQRQCATDHLVLSLEHETGRQARPPTTLALHLAAPAWQASHLQALLKEKLDRLVLEAPVMAVSLRTLSTVARPHASATLFPEPGGSAEDRVKLLDLLVARLGPEQVKQAGMRLDHRPEQANHWLPALHPAPPPCPLANADRPFWLLDPPVALRTHHDKPYYGSALSLVKGPERIETGWWDGGLAIRDYFVAQDAQFIHYWIYRERDHAQPRWFLHGLFA